LSHLERRLLFYTGVHGRTEDPWKWESSKLASSSRQNLQLEMLRNLRQGTYPFNDDGSPKIIFRTEDGDPNEMLAELACAFGGSLVVDGDVYIRDRVQVRMLFTEARGGGGWHYLSDVYIQAMAQLCSDCFGGNIKDQIFQYAVGFELHKALEFADSPRFAGHEEKVRAYKALVGQMRNTVEISK